MSTVIVCLDGASNRLVHDLGVVFEGRPEGWTWGPSPDSLTALRVAEAMRRGDAMPQERRQVWEARQGNITETVTLWDLPQSVYTLAFLNAEEDSEPETFGRRVLENKTELDALLDSMTNATTICVAIAGSALRTESAESAQRTAWLLRSILRFAASLPCGNFVPLLVCDEERPSTTEEEWLKAHLPLLSSLETPPKLFFATPSEHEDVVKLILTANPAILATYERATKARQTLCKTIRECETWTPTSTIIIKPGILRKALNTYIEEIKHLQWPLAVDLLDDEQPLPDLNAVKTDLDALVGFVKKTPVRLTRVEFQSWSFTAPKLKTLAGKHLMESVKKYAMDDYKKRMMGRLLNGLIIGIVGLAILLFIVMTLSTP